MFGGNQIADMVDVLKKCSQSIIKQDWNARRSLVNVQTKGVFTTAMSGGKGTVKHKIVTSGHAISHMGGKGFMINLPSFSSLGKDQAGGLDL